MRIIKIPLVMLLLAMGVSAKTLTKKEIVSETSKKCSGKPGAPDHATVRCFKKSNTCEATCKNGYTFTKKDSKSAMYDCQDGKWLMKGGEDICQLKVSNQCSGKPDAPRHATVKCFKKHNTCEATCKNGYTFTKNGSKSAIYDCEDGKWLMRGEEDRCHRSHSGTILKSRTDEDKIHLRTRDKMIKYDYDNYNYDYNYTYESDYYDYVYDADDCVSPWYLCNGTNYPLYCIIDSWLCDYYEDCDDGADELGCDYQVTSITTMPTTTDITTPSTTTVINPSLIGPDISKNGQNINVNVRVNIN